MTKPELNKSWAELEGWKVGNATGFWYGPLQSVAYGESPPDFTEPNRFFAEVVPRMIDLKFSVSTSHYEIKEGVHHGIVITAHGKFHSQDTKYFSGFSLDSIGIAGLEAAIKARKELET